MDALNPVVVRRVVNRCSEYTKFTGSCISWCPYKDENGNCWVVMHVLGEWKAELEHRVKLSDLPPAVRAMLVDVDFLVPDDDGYLMFDDGSYPSRSNLLSLVNRQE